MRGLPIRRNEGCRTPTAHIALDTETCPTVERDGTQLHRLMLGCAIYWRCDSGKPAGREEFIFTTTAQFWDWLAGRLSPHRPTWLWAHNAMFDWTVLRLWERLDSGAVRAEWAALDAPPFILSGTFSGCRVVLVDTLNWFRVPLSELGQWVNRPKLEMPGEGGELQDWADYCVRDVEIVEATVQALCRTVREFDLGVMRYTLPGQAHAHWRHSHMRHTVVPPAEGPESRLARAALYGGRTDVFFRGRVRSPLLTDWLPNPEALFPIPQLPAGPVYSLDVNSMYGSVLETECLPTACMDYSESVSVLDLERALTRGQVIAEVDIETDREMPIRIDGVGTVYAVGRFTTALCTPELIEVFRNGRVHAVERAASYTMAPIADRFASQWLARRVEYQRAGNRVMEQFAKGMLNSWFGKWAQQASAWVEVDDGEIPPVRWGQWAEPDARRVVRQYRVRYGILEVEEGEHETATSFPAIAAHVTSFARDRMSVLGRIAGERCVVWQCVDALHVINGGLSRLREANCIDPTAPGKLRPGPILDDVTYWGIGCREENGRPVMLGVPSGAVPVGAGAYKALDFEGPASILGRVPDGTVRVTPVLINPSRHYRHRKTTASGWTQPLRLPADFPDRKELPAASRRSLTE